MREILISIFLMVSNSNAASKPSGVKKEVRKIRYQVYRQICEGIKCKQTPIKSGQVEIALNPESDQYSWGVITNNFKDQKSDYKLIIHVSKEGQKKYRLDGSISKETPGQKLVFSSAAIVTEGYVPGLELVLAPSEGAGPQTRVSLVLD